MGRVGPPRPARRYYTTRAICRRWWWSPS